MKQNIVVLMGIIFFIGGCFLGYTGFSNYQEQQSQKDWPTADAVVTSVEQRWEISGSRRHRRGKWVYDITYEYMVNDTVYTGEIVGSTSKKEIDEPFSVKYDPEDPSVSTSVLSPQIVALILYLLGGLLFLGLGLGMIIFPQGIKGRKSKVEPDFTTP